MKNFFEKVWKVVEEIPKGKVATYGQIAKILGHPNCARAVGYALHANPFSATNQNKNARVVPCHRVVNRFGALASGFAFGGETVQRQLLTKEGIEFNENGRVDLSKFSWQPMLTEIE